MTLHNETQLPDDPLRVICSCGHSARYETVSTLEQDGGEVTYHQNTDLYAAICPSCSTPRPVKVGTFDWDDIGTEFCLTLGSFEDGYTPFETGLDTQYDLARTDFSDVANPVYIARQRFDPTCIRCGERLTETDRKTDGNAPELGWEYYQCPECGEQMRPNAVDHLGNESP